MLPGISLLVFDRCGAGHPFKNIPKSLRVGITYFQDDLVDGLTACFQFFLTGFYPHFLQVFDYRTMRASLETSLESTARQVQLSSQPIYRDLMRVIGFYILLRLQYQSIFMIFQAVENNERRLVQLVEVHHEILSYLDR